VRARKRVADVRNKQPSPTGIAGEAIWSNPHGNLFDARNVGGHEKADGVLSAVRREYQIGLGDQRARDSGELGVDLLARHEPVSQRMLELTDLGTLFDERRRRASRSR
jgi:hypothetical protein